MPDSLGANPTPAQVATYLNAVRDDILFSVSTMPRLLVISAGSLSASGSLRLTAFTADKTLLANNVATLTNGAAGATPTLCRVGIYSVNEYTNDCTLIGSTANDTTLWAAGFTRYIKALSVATQIMQGKRYAVGLLCVTGAAVPTFYGSGGVPAADSLVVPFVAASLASQSDLPSTIAGTSLAASGSAMYSRITS